MAQRVVKVTGTRGEITPLAHARADIQLYQSSFAKLHNWLTIREGVVRRRSGTKYRGAAKHSNKEFRFLDFIYSDDQSYAIELGDQYARFWTRDGQVESSGSPYEISTPWTEAMLGDVDWQQSGDVLYIAYKNSTIPPKKLSRSAHTSWSVSDVDFRDGPYLPINDVANTATTSAAPTTGGTTTITMTNTDNINGGAGFASTDVGRHFRWQQGGKWSWGKITAHNSTTSVDVTWEDGQGGTGGSLSWRLGLFSGTTGYPGSVRTFDGRLMWGGTVASPRTIAYSMSGLPERYSPSDVDGTVTDDNGGIFDIISGDRILWLHEAPRLQIGTPLAIRSFGAQNVDETFGPRNVREKLEINEGVQKTRPVTVGPSTIHASQFGSSVNDLFFDYQVNSLINPELSVSSEHLFDSPVKEFAFQVQPYRRLWTLLEDGTLVASAIDRYEKVVGFAPQDIGGTVFAMTAIPGDGKTDVFFGVERTINGNTVKYIETIQPDFLRDSVEDAWFVDCGGEYDSTATNTISGITHLANMTVDILADGKVLPQATVNGSGVLTLPNDVEAEHVIYGIPITECEIELLRPPLQTQSGTGLGRKLRVIAVDVDVYETSGLIVTTDTGKEDELRERPAAKGVSSINGLAIGTYRVMFDGSWSGEGIIGFKMDKPLPATIRAVNVYLDAED